MGSMKSARRVTTWALVLAMSGAMAAGCAHKRNMSDEARLREQQRVQNEKMLAQARKEEAKRAADEKRVADARAREESQRAADDRRLADAQSQDDQRAAAQQAESDRKAAEARAKEEAKLADARAKEEKKAAEARAKQQARADAEAKKRQNERDKQFMPPEDEMRTLDAFVQAETAAGAREDGMLFDNHFDGTHLNTAGQQKLNEMLQNRADAKDTATVYLSLPANDPNAAARRASLEEYLQQSGLANNVQIKEGDNPDMRTSASRGLTTLQKTDSDYQSSGGGQTTGYKAAPMTQGTNDTIK